jgi:hypothetical protein
MEMRHPVVIVAVIVLELVSVLVVQVLEIVRDGRNQVHPQKGVLVPIK